MKIVQSILVTVLVLFPAYFIVAGALILIDGKPNNSAPKQDEITFNQLKINYAGLPPLSSYTCRDGTSLNYRYYPAQTNNVLALLHGSGYHSKYLFPLAKYISSENLAQVYTQDLRGHRVNPARRGDIDYIDQLEDDVADLMALIKQNHPGSTLILGGHSSGGDLAIRTAGSKYSKEVDAFMLLSPFLKYNAPTVRGLSDWAFAHMFRIIGLTMLNNFGITAFNYLDVVNFNMPIEYRDGTETLSYSYRLNTGYAPRDYRSDLRAMT